MASSSKRKYIIIGLIAIIVVYTLYSVFLAYASYANDIPRKVRHINRLLCILVIYGIGYFSFKKVGVKWVVDTWNIIYFSIAFLLVLTGVYDWLLGPSPLGLRAIAKNFNE